MSVNTYSKEFLLAAFKIIENPPDAELWHCPDSIVVSQVSQQPLAFSPLTQHEKNLLDSGNVNSQQANRRQQQMQNQQRKHGGGRMRGGRMEAGERRPFQDKRKQAADQQSSSAVVSPMENEHNDGAVPEDLWDSPEKSADTQSSAGMASAQLGAFADGKFVISNPELSTKSSSSQQPERQRKSRFATFFSSASGEAEEEDDDASAQAAPVSGLSVPSRHNLSSSGNALAQIPGAFPAMSQVEHQTLSAQPPLINLYQQQQQQQQIIGGLGMHRQDPMLTATAAVSMQGPPARMPAPSAVTAAPQILWLYKDPHGNIQGPFGRAEMEQWFEAGYFPDNLLIKQTTDDRFEELIFYMQRFGAVTFSRPSPSYFEQDPRIGLGASMSGRFHLQQQQQQLAYELQQQQQALIERQQRYELIQQQQQQHQQQKLQQPPSSSKEGGESQHSLPSVKKAQQHQPKQQRQHSLKQQQKEEALSHRLEVAATVSDEQRSQNSKPVTGEQQQQHQPPQSPTLPADALSPTTEAAWQQQRQGKRLSIREIQQMEKLEQEQRRQKRQQEAQEKLKKEIAAAHLQQQQQQQQINDSKLPLNWAAPATQSTQNASIIAWGGTGVNETKKSLLEIQQEEEREVQRRALITKQQRQVNDNVNIGAVRRYPGAGSASSMAVTATSSWSSKASTGLPPSNNLIPPARMAAAVNQKANGSGVSNNGLVGSIVNDANSSSSMESLHTAPSRSGANTPLKMSSNSTTAPATAGAASTLDDTVQWCRDQLRPLEGRLDVGSFMEMLLPLKDAYMIAEIIHDAIGTNYTLVDPQYFLQEYLQRRHRFNQLNGNGQLVVPPPPNNSSYAVALRQGTYKPNSSGNSGELKSTTTTSSSSYARKKDADKGFIQVVRKGKTSRGKRGEETPTGAPVGVGGRTVVGATLKTP